MIIQGMRQADVTGIQVQNVMRMKLIWPYQNLHIKGNFHWCSLQWTSNVSALWYFLITFHLTSVKKEYFPLFLEDEFQYTISPSQAISSFSMTLLFSVSVLHLGCLDVYHWDSQEHNLQYVWPQQPSHQLLMREREKVSETLDNNSADMADHPRKLNRISSPWKLQIIWVLLIGINQTSASYRQRDRPDSKWESIQYMVH